MNNKYDRELPKELIKGMHSYIIHDYGCSFADFMSNNRQKTIKYLQDNHLEIMEIKMESNIDGLNDYRIFTRKESGYND